ncbi:MAG: metal-dependent hydrolase [Planctomycetes bacterium]|nr:metal-dependent hydrolase [Planctomycetota bacterium]
MASFRGHLTTSAILGAMYGFAGFWSLGIRWWMGALGSGMTAMAGLLPDLDSDSSVPNRTLFRIAAPFAGLVTLQHALIEGLSLERALLRMLLAFLIVRYVCCYLMRKMTVHRGMFHSIPAMLIAGLTVFLIYLHLEGRLRLFLAGAVVAGYLSHLILDEICAVDFQGGRIKKPFGTALKLFSQNWIATAICYGVLFLLVFLVLMGD